ncbi:MAG TPA: DUF4384 domain-containing protein, partial [Afifellaceae bacterium]|nr:DUF4384 domain-containing protein [Afifellaceae bacterium]
EFGTETETLKERLLAAGGAGPLLAGRLEQGTVPRDQFEAEFASLVERVVDATPIAGDGTLALADYIPPATRSGPVKVSIVADKARYRLGDKPVFTVSTNRDCHLTLVNVDGRGVGTVIFPNRFDRDNSIRANRAFPFPAANAAFDFAFTEAGTETVIAICDTSGNALIGVKHDFDASAFTDLGAAAYRKIDVVKREKPAASSTGQALPAIGRSAVKLTVN